MIRRRLILPGLLTTLFALTAGFNNLSAQQPSDQEGNIAVSPIEDLMREHGVLRRILLIYEKELKGMDNDKNPQYDVIFKSANIIHEFIEGYHEKLEEDHIFPIFEKAVKLTDLTKTLREQHEAGRKLTREILRFSKAKETGSKDNPNALAGNLRSFIKMYRPHAAREDTVLLPALRKFISEKEYDELGDKFEDKERELFGENGFENIVKEVEDIEKSLGIYELSRFTPAGKL
ncbi:MAG: hemerythrin domain-containing protein [Candidatus Omnitrophica bacterium]|nr:hemerythrin domain-containing protein [Candidatus Omnitrophota bacterium]